MFYLKLVKGISLSRFYAERDNYFMKIIAFVLVSLIASLMACSAHEAKALQLISLEELAQLEQEQAAQVAGTTQAEPGQLILNKPQ